MNKYFLILTFLPFLNNLFFAEQAGGSSNVINLFIIGDSTASVYSVELYPRAGWGQVFQAFFIKEKVKINNVALSGRSSKSFYDGGAWSNVYNALKKGDYVFIQFGHNDSKPEKERQTSPFTTYKEYLEIYIDNTREKGAIPVLLTQIPRNKWKDGKLVDTHGDYLKATKEVAEAQKVQLIDVHRKAVDLFESMGEKKMDEIFLKLKKGKYPNYPKGIDDNTHLQENGAKEICRLITGSIKDLKLDLEAYLKNHKK